MVQAAGSSQECENEATLLGYDGEFPGMNASDLAFHVAIADLVRSVYTESRPHPEEVLERFALLAATYIPGVAHASVVLVAGHRGVRPSLASSGIGHLTDKIQEETVEGPALDAIAGHHTVRADNLAEETRWPRFTHEVLAHTPVRSMLCYRLYTDIQDWGALNLQANTPHAFGPEAEQAGLVLATHAAVTLQAVARTRQFRSALGSRDIIGQAKGMLMERYDITAAASFALLTRLSQESNKPVVVIAKELVEKKTAPRQHEH
jgi:transcriptional regulator with GAF, ATPase, and Fis domain